MPETYPAESMISGPLVFVGGFLRPTSCGCTLADRRSTKISAMNTFDLSEHPDDAKKILPDLPDLLFW